uniref:NADH-ubiquinone oxidoreductase chain 2 n=1 Tax=Cylindrotoma sp. ZK-2016 TaxID=1808010 RepID=A0A192U5I8_9DIPT|nr:NADH dehydrogenase subunit 2 [Cylindrotoma sp. ZK-2016]
MFNNLSKLIFMFTLMTGTLITVSANSWMSAWMGLEINLLSFIPLMINTNNLLSSEASLKYFLVQALASAILLFTIILIMFTNNLNWFINETSTYTMLMINSTLLLKSGAAPFHFWFPGVMEGLSWMNNLILMTWQKIAPLMLISYFNTPQFLIIIIILSIMIGSLGGLNQTSLRKIMAFSSINHLGWMLAAMISNELLWEIYFLIYSLLSFTLIFMFNCFKLFHINQTFSMFNNQNLVKFFLFTGLLSLGGLPPFLGFMPKWLVIQSLTSNNFVFLMIAMVCLTLITLYYYIRLCYASLMLNYWEMNWHHEINLNKFNQFMMISLAFISLTGFIFISLLYF